MNIAQTALDDLRIELAVTLNPDDYNPRVDRALKRHQQQAEMPGFRKGKVPLQLIRRQYGQSVLAEELNQMLGEQLQNHIQENKLNVLGNPIPSGEDRRRWGLEQPWRFHFQLRSGPGARVEP